MNSCLVMLSTSTALRSSPVLNVQWQSL